MPLQRPFAQVDVFTAIPYLGNALAVVLDGTGLSDAEMQRFARWTNLAETTFLLPPSAQAAAQGADYQVRIFTTAYEMPFAGHPTLGSCHAWLEAGATPQQVDVIVQQCQTGLVKIRRTKTSSGQRLAFAAPPLTRHEATPQTLSQIGTALGLYPDQIIAAQHLNNGPHHFGVLVDSHQTVLDLTPNYTTLESLLPGIGVTGVGVAAVKSTQVASNLIARSSREAGAFGRTPANAEEPDLQVRFFATGNQVSEDPATGSFNASLAQWLMAEGHAPARYIAAQGSCIGCDARLYLERDAAGQVWVGGDAVTCISGMVALP